MARYARRLIFWICGSLLALLLLALLVIIVVVLTIDPDRFRGRIEMAASAAIGRNVELSGGLHWRLGWRTAIESRGGRIANAAGFGVQPFAEWQSLRLGVALRPLLRREVQIDHVELVGARVRLQRTAVGLGNWSFAPEGNGEAAGTGTRQDVKIRVGSLALRDATVFFQDAASGRDWQFSQLRLDVKLPPDLLAPDLSFGGVALQGQAGGAPFASSGVPFSMQADAIRFDPVAGAIEVPAWTMGWADARLEGALQARTMPSMAASGRLALRAPSLRALLASVSFPAPATRDEEVLGKLDLASRIEWQDGVARIDELKIALDDTELAGRIELPSLMPLAIRFELSADEVEVDRYLQPEDAPSKPFELPLAALKSLDAKGVLTIREARMLGAAAKELRIDVE